MAIHCRSQKTSTFDLMNGYDRVTGGDLEARPETIPNQGSRALITQQTDRRSFSAVSKAMLQRNIGTGEVPVPPNH